MMTLNCRAKGWCNTIMNKLWAVKLEGDDVIVNTCCSRSPTRWNEYDFTMYIFSKIFKFCYNLQIKQSTGLNAVLLFSILQTWSLRNSYNSKLKNKLLF